MTTEELNEQTKDEWRELGFFYDYDKENFCWRLIGSRQGLLKFSKLLKDYANDERNAPLSEHEHYGPYWYLKLVTWNKAEITSDAIAGTLEDFKRLSNLTKQKLENAAIGDKITIDVEYSPENEAKILFEIKEDNFDAAKADTLL
jgi:hypothetical protein